MSRVYTAINHSTGEILEAPSLKTIFDIIRSARRWDRREGIAPDRWTIHAGSYNEIRVSFYEFPGVMPNGDQVAWAF